MTANVRALITLCLACSSKVLSTLEDALKNSRYSAITASTSDQAVKLCMSHFNAAALVDAKSVRGQEWSVVETLKGVRASLPVILLEERHGKRKSPLPDGVDAVVSTAASPRDLLNKPDELIKKTGIRAARV